MRKKVLLVIGLFISFSIAKAQDTLVFEDFNDTILVCSPNFFPAYPLAIVGDTNWTNYDEDQLPDASPGGRPGEWYGLAYAGTITDSIAHGTCFISNSWTNASATPIANWMITPSIFITDSVTAQVSWLSTPYQTPMYLDGYVVLVSTTNNDLPSFTDTLFIAAEYDDEGGTYPEYCGDFTPYNFIPAGEFVHGLDATYIEVNPDFDMNAADTTCADSSRFNGLSRPFSVSLSQYYGMNIYIAWKHNSHDDNILAIDDLCVSENSTSLVVENLPDLAGSIYPNPATDFVNVQFDIGKYHHAHLQMVNNSGQVMYSSVLSTFNHRIDLTNIAAGIYFVKIMTDEGNMVRKVVVNK